MNQRRERQAEILSGLASFRPKIIDETSCEKITYKEIIRALGSFMECIRYLNVRRSGGLQASITGEADVQDFIYLMLRPWIGDLRYENPTDKVGNRHAVK